MTNKKVAIVAVILVVVATLLNACSAVGGFYDDNTLRVKSKLNIGEYDVLTMQTKSDGYLMENDKVRLVLNENGSIREYANKQANVYLVKDATNATPSDSTENRSFP